MRKATATGWVQLGAAMCLAMTGCKTDSDAQPAAAEAQAQGASGALTGVPRPSLLLTQAQFQWEEGPDGKRTPKPGPAKLLILKPGNVWQAEVLEDEDSRVFHKAVCQSDGTLLTIGGTDAHLKTWKRGSKWESTSHWKPSFGGKWDRLRDFEIGDVNGDGKDELVIATHDQGVVAVATLEDGVYQPKEITRKPETFIHEIEIGDVDGDGKQEFYATPSAPNKADASQGGGVAVFTADGEGGYQQSMVAEFASRHAKEILVTDLDGDGKDELYVSLEARTEKTGNGTQMLEPLEIRRYERKGEQWTHRTVATLPKGLQARVLLAGDLTGEGKKELVVTTFKDGVWRLTPTAQGPFTATQIDADSSGFEHAAALLDLDGDGKNELYVAADEQDEVRRYVWNGTRFERETIYTLGKSDLTWSIEGCL